MTAFTKSVANYIGSNHSLVLNGLRSIDRSALSGGRMFISQPVTVRACNKLSKMFRAIGLSSISNKLKHRVIITTNSFANELKSRGNFERKQQMFDKSEGVHSTLVSYKMNDLAPKVADAQEAAIQRANTAKDQAKSEKVIAEKKHIMQLLKVVNSQIRALYQFKQAVSLTGEAKDRVLKVHEALIDGSNQRLRDVLSVGNLVGDLPSSLKKEAKHVKAQCSDLQKKMNQARARFNTLENTQQNTTVVKLDKHATLEKLLEHKQDLENRYKAIAQQTNSSKETIKKQINKCIFINNSISETTRSIDDIVKKIKTEESKIESCEKVIKKILSTSGLAEANYDAQRQVKIIEKHHVSIECLHKQRLDLQSKLMALMGAAERLDIKMGKEPEGMLNIASPSSLVNINTTVYRFKNTGSQTDTATINYGFQTKYIDNVSTDAVLDQIGDVSENLGSKLSQNNSGETSEQKAIGRGYDAPDEIASHATIRPSVPSVDEISRPAPVKPSDVFNALKEVGRQFMTVAKNVPKD